MSWELLGHTWAEKLLKKHITREEARHAYLFTGAPGIGRRSLALEFACALNCTQPPAPGEACGECRICMQTARMQLTDMSLVAPEAEGGMIKVDQIRALQHSLSLTPYEAKYRIALLPNFQFANPNAQNALLKTLEEAPRQVILLLTADSAEKLLPTISSRCEILRLRPVTVKILEDSLQFRWNLPPEKAHLYANLSNGRTGLALRMAGDPQMLKKRQEWIEKFFSLLPLNRRDRFHASESLARERDQLRLTMQVWLSLARDLLLASSGLADKITNIDFQIETMKYAHNFDPKIALGLVTSLVTALNQLEVNANLRLMTDVLLLDFPYINPTN